MRLNGWSRTPLVEKHDGVALATSWLRCNVTAVPSDTAERWKQEKVTKCFCARRIVAKL
jgi:hypothetical protein